MIDEIDRKILNLIQEDARISNADIGRRVGLTPSATLERMRRLSDRGPVMGFFCRIEPKAVGLGLLAFVSVRAEDLRDPRAIAKNLAGLPEVLEVHNVAGEDCYIVKLRAADTD